MIVYDLSKLVEDFEKNNKVTLEQQQILQSFLFFLKEKYNLEHCSPMEFVQKLYVRKINLSATSLGGVEKNESTWII